MNIPEAEMPILSWFLNECTLLYPVIRQRLFIHIGQTEWSQLKSLDIVINRKAWLFHFKFNLDLSKKNKTKNPPSNNPKLFQIICLREVGF